MQWIDKFGEKIFFSSSFVGNISIEIAHEIGNIDKLSYNYVIMQCGKYIASGKAIDSQAAKRIVINILKENNLIFIFPKIRDLPKNERALFEMWLSTKERPIVLDDVTQDYYYPWDYDLWKQT